jgi:hypothetical protein
VDSDPDPYPHQNVMVRNTAENSEKVQVTYLQSQSRQECQAFSPVDRIGSSRPLTRKLVLHPPLGFQEGTHSLMGEGAGGANSDEGQTHSGTPGTV